MADVRDIWGETSQVALNQVAHQRVAERWDEPSNLPGMTIGALAAHVLNSGIMMLEESLDEPIPDGRPLTTAIVFSLISLDPEHADNTFVRDLTLGQSAESLVDLVDRATRCRERLVDRLRQEPRDRVVGLAVAAVHQLPWALDEFVGARILELVVHLDDLMTSLGDEELPVSRDALVFTSHLGIEICLRRFGSLPVMRALYRRDRSPLDSLRPV